MSVMKQFYKADLPGLTMTDLYWAHGTQTTTSFRSTSPYCIISTQPQLSLPLSNSSVLFVCSRASLSCASITVEPEQETLALTPLLKRASSALYSTNSRKVSFAAH